MIKMQMRTELTVMDGLQRLKKQAPKRMQQEFKAIDKKRQPALLKDLQKEPPKPKFRKGEFPWTSRAQQVAVMIKYRKLGIKRYTRTHRFSQGWRVRRYMTKTGQIYAVTNPWDKAHFVVGDSNRKVDRQQRFHKMTGWMTAQQLDETLDKHAKQVTFDLAKVWRKVTSELMNG